MNTTRRTCLMAAALAAGMAGCGFELRKPPNYAFNTLFSSIPIASPFGAKLRRSLESSGQVEVITDARQIERADVIFDQLFEFREKVIVGRTSTGAIREFQLRYRVLFQVRNQEGFEKISDAEMVQKRDISFDETAVLAKDAVRAVGTVGGVWERAMGWCWTDQCTD